MFRHWFHALRIPLGQLRVGSHRLRVETDHQIDRSDMIYKLCHLQEVEIESHFIFKCPIYYEIRERFHCLFRGPQTLAAFFRYIDQRCLALYIHEALTFQAQVLQPLARPDTTQRITTFFNVMPPSRGTKICTDLDSDPISRSIKICRY